MNDGSRCLSMIDPLRIPEIVRRLTNRGLGLWRKRRLLALERAGAPPG